MRPPPISLMPWRRLGGARRSLVNDGTLLNTCKTGAAPKGIAFDGLNLWVANYGGNTVSKIRATDCTVLATVPPWSLSSLWRAPLERGPRYERGTQRALGRERLEERVP